jgi:hypothetical protein
LSVLITCCFLLDIQQRNHKSFSTSSAPLSSWSFQAATHHVHNVVVEEFGDLSLLEVKLYRVAWSLMGALDLMGLLGLRGAWWSILSMKSLLLTLWNFPGQLGMLGSQELRLEECMSWRHPFTQKSHLYSN